MTTRRDLSIKFHRINTLKTSLEIRFIKKKCVKTKSFDATSEVITYRFIDSTIKHVFILNNMLSK